VSGDDTGVVDDHIDPTALAPIDANREHRNECGTDASRDDQRDEAESIDRRADYIGEPWTVSDA